MNKTVVAIVALLLVAGGAYYFMSQKGTSPLTSIPLPGLSSSTPGMAPIVGGGELPSGSVVASLRDDNVIVGSIIPKNIQPAIDFVDDLKARFKATALWKKQGLDAVFDSMKKGGTGKSVLGEIFKVDDETAQARAEEIWNATEEIVFTTSSATVDHGNGMKLPKVGVRARFANQQVAQDASGFIRTEIMKGQPRLDDPKSKSYLQVREGSDNTFDFVLESEKDGLMLKGSVVAEGNELTAVLGANSFDEFVAQSGEAKLVDSASWKSVQPGIMPSSGVIMYVASSAMVDVVDQALGVNEPPKEVQDQIELMFNQWDDMVAMSTSMDFDQGLNSTSCVETKPGSKLNEMYAKFMKGRADHVSSGKPSFYKLVGENSLLALRVSFDVVPFAIDMIEQSYQGALEADPNLRQEAEQFRSIMNKAREITEKFAFYEVGIVANATPGGMMPEAGIYLGGSRLGGEELLKELASTYNEFAPQKGPQSIAMVSSDEQGPVMNIPVGMAAQLSGRVIGDNSVVLATTPFFHSAAKRMIEADGSYLQREGKNISDPVNKLGAGDYLFYLNTDVAIQMMQPWYPMVAQQVPGASVQEVEELANLLKTQFISLQHSQMLNDKVMCSRAESFVLQ